jgi:magnesium chelatase accessory protein
MSSRLRWESEGRGWPQRQTSHFVDTTGVTWRVVRDGAGPTLLLLHGTGSSAHSWAGTIPELSRHFTVIAPDLPGHAFTRGRPRGGMSLHAIFQALSELMASLEAKPVIVVGHSAGAAIALEYARQLDPDLPVIGFNPALMPFPGIAARLFPAIAKLLFVNPFAPRLFARMARVPGETERFLIRATGSRIPYESVRCYRTLLGNSRHCEGALEMMATWNLPALAAALPTVRNPVLLIHSRQDSAIPLEQAREAAALLPQGALVVEEGLGHLAHEENPAMAAQHIVAFARAQGVLKQEETAT